MRHERYDLPDWASLVAALDTPESEYSKRWGRSSRKEGSPEWDLNAGWYQTREYCGAAGWPEGAARIRQYTDRWVPQLASLVALPQYTPDVTGEYFDVGVLMTGEPEHWFAREDAPAAVAGGGAVHRVVINLSASAGVDASALVRRGAAVAALVSALELSGASTEVIACAAIQGYGREASTLTISLALKRPGDALDLDRLALLAVHPAGLRRIWFALWESMLTDAQRDRYEVRKHHRYGLPTDLPLAEQGDVYAPAMRGSAGAFGDDTAAEAWVREQLKRLGAIQ